MMENKTGLEYGPPTRLVSMGLICIVGLIYLPNIWWGFILKFLLGMSLLGTIGSSFKDLWEEYETMGAFVTVQLVSFTAILLFGNIDTVRWMACFVIVFGWFTMHKRIKGHVRKKDLAKE
jgi:hypothetical protein